VSIHKGQKSQLIPATWQQNPDILRGVNIGTVHNGYPRPRKGGDEKKERRCTSEKKISDKC
jgi:hypothetical protein